MVIFNIVKYAIDSIYTLVKKSPDEIDSLVKQSLMQLSASYGSLRRGSKPNYSQWPTWVAYIYKYVPAHANFLYQIIQNTPGLPEKFQTEEIRLCSIGGGPGSDVLAVSKYLARHRLNTPMRARVYDRELGWEHVWKLLSSQLSPPLSNDQISTSYHLLDLDRPEVWVSDTECLNANVFTMIFFHSEARINDRCSQYLEHIFRRSTKDSVFIFLDNNVPEWYQELDAIAARAGLTLLSEPGACIRNIGDAQNEEKTLLEPYRSRFGTDPKLDGNVAWRVFIKE